MTTLSAVYSVSITLLYNCALSHFSAGNSKVKMEKAKFAGAFAKKKHMQSYLFCKNFEVGLLAVW